MHRVTKWLPEAGLLLLAVFFTFRELGTFPAAWEDSGLYTMIAQSVARGEGYALQILDNRWMYPYFLSVGPTVIVPVAAVIKFFGFSLVTTRLVSACYLLASTLAFYLYTRRITGLSVARWSTALLITLSAFINTGKPVQGSIAAFFFLLLGLYTLQSARQTRSSALLTGLFFGLAILTKLTFALLLPALLCIILSQLWSERRIPTRLIITVSIAVLIPLCWLGVELYHQQGFNHFLYTVFTRAPGDGILQTLWQKVFLLKRFQYQYFAALVGLAILGFRSPSLRFSPNERLFMASLFLFFLLFFLVRSGWYRHLLLAHLLLIPFVPLGAFRLLGKQAGTILLTVFVLAQGLWQLDHRGSSRSIAGAEAAHYIETHLANRDLLIQHPEIMIRLPQNPHWLYYPLGGTEELIPARYTNLTRTQRCLPFVRKLNGEEQVVYKDSLTSIGGSYFLVEQPLGCEDR